MPNRAGPSALGTAKLTTRPTAHVASKDEPSLTAFRSATDRSRRVSCSTLSCSAFSGSRTTDIERGRYHAPRAGEMHRIIEQIQILRTHAGIAEDLRRIDEGDVMLTQVPRRSEEHTSELQSL